MSERDDENEAQAQASPQVDGAKTELASQSDATDDEVSGYLMESGEEDELQTFLGRH